MMQCSKVEELIKSGNLLAVEVLPIVSTRFAHGANTLKARAHLVSFTRKVSGHFFPLLCRRNRPDLHEYNRCECDGQRAASSRTWDDPQQHRLSIEVILDEVW